MTTNPPAAQLRRVVRLAPQPVASHHSLLLLGLSTLLGLAHHADHVLRLTHSGWPFTPHVTPFTFSLGVYPLLLLAALLRRRPRSSAILTLVVLALTLFSHTVFETPHDQYGPWASGDNLMHHASPLMGDAAVVLASVLAAMLLITAVSFLRDARR